ncbi:ribosomal protein S3 [Rhinolophus ferrumequinum]|uniref:KH type-2 domain-containing protein n=13 Tax=Boreoeutheria TaxID=1437010 RepID=A0ABI7ZX91_FELCA|nr:ribosomal protein S3 [Rhinolophus ferrumequinum]KAF6438917.1 ribosomal protein S3 [Molossus molossus]KAF6467550.1 ribosomal protein S3 [Rousettus aegyptiacus]
MAVQISKKRKFVADGIFKAELNEFLTRELAEDGYSGVEVRVTPTRTEIIILATRTQNVLGEKGRRIRELTAVVQKRFGFPEGSVELYAEKVATRGVLGIKVKIMLPWDPSGKIGPKKPLPDHVSIVEPKDEILPTTPISEQKGGKPEPPAMPQPVPTA